MIIPTEADVGRRVRYIGENHKDLFRNGGTLAGVIGSDYVLVSWDDGDRTPVLCHRGDLDWELGGDRLGQHPSDRRPTQATPQAPADLEALARTAVTYALNLAYGRELEPFEREHVTTIASSLGIEVTAEVVELGASRRVTAEVLRERRRQVEVHGYGPEHDLANPLRLHQEVLARVLQLPGPRARADLVEAAAIIVAEIERIDRLAGKVEVTS